jgi:hypothetical protein
MPTACGVYVRTWGTKDSEEDTGVTQVTQNYLTNLDIGHSSIELIIPNTPENWEKVEHYLKNTGIPYFQEKIETKKVFFVEGKPIISDENAYEEEVIKIYFSWWPSINSEKPFDFHTLEMDLICERLTAHVDYKPEWEAYLRPEKRYREWLFSKMITLPPNQMLHFRGASEEEIQLLISYHDCTKIVQDIQAFNFLAEKLRTKTGKYLLHTDFSHSEKLLFKQFFPQMFIEEQEYIDADKFVIEVNAYAEKLLQAYHDASSRLYHFINQFNEKEKKELGMLLELLAEKRRYTPSEKKTIDRILTKHNLLDANPEQIFQYVQNELNSQGTANKMVAQLSPLLTDLNLQLKDIKQKISTLKDEKKQIDTHLLLLSFAKQESDFSHAELLVIGAEIEENLRTMRDLKEQVETAMIEVRTQHDEAKTQALSLGYKKLDSLMDKHITTGQLPDHTVNFGLKGKNKPGMDFEIMLMRMSDFARGKQPFKLITFNCSHTVCEVLAAGAGNRAGIFQQRALSGSFATPQMVYNNSLKYSESLTPGIDLGIIEKENTWQNYFANCALASLEETLNAEGVTLTRGWSLFKAVSAAATCVTLENAKALFQAKNKPKKKIE